MIHILNPYIYSLEAGVSTRIVVGGGANSGAQNDLQWFQGETAGNATSYGSLTLARYWAAATSSSTRGVWWCGQDGDNVGDTVIDYIELATGGTATSFGTATSRWSGAGCSNETRALYSGGSPSSSGNRSANIYTILIASTGNSSGYGSVYIALGYHTSTCSSTRALYAGGITTTSIYLNAISYSTISTSSTSTDFGDLVATRAQIGSCSDGTTALFAGGVNSSGAAQDDIYYVTIATTANASTWGLLVTNTQTIPSACSSNVTRGFVGGGFQSPAATDMIQSILFASTGNASDWGNLAVARSATATCSSAHGGL